MNQEKNKEFQDVGELMIPTICEEDEEGIERLIENFKKLKQQNSSLLERVRLLESQDKKEPVRTNKHEVGSSENLLKVPNNSSSDPSSSISVSPDISCTDSICDHKPLVQAPSSSEEDLDTDYNEAKSLEISSGYLKKYSDKETLDDPLALPKKCSQKEHKTAWSKMKEIITTTKVGGTKKRHSVEDPGEISKLPDEQALNSKLQGLNECRLQAPRLVLTHPSTEDLNRPRPPDGGTRKAQEKHRPSPLQPTWQETSPVDEEGQGESSPPLTRKSSKWFKVKNVFLPSPGSHSNKSTSNPSSPQAFKSFTYEVDPEDLSSYDNLDESSKEANTNIQDEVKKNYKQLQKKLSDEFHCKFVEWEKSRKCGGSFSSGNSSVDECERRRFQETEELRSYGGGPDTNMSPPEKKLTSEFKKKLEEWDRLKSGNESVVPLSPGREQPRRKISDWQGWGRANSQRKKEEGKKRRGSDSPGRKEGHSLKELAWLDKELAKVEKEKIRLEKEREKYNQREARLKKMKLALESSREEVLIPTSTGTFRFQGISEKFTKKLYEWEKARGIGPEESTIALLDPTYSLKTTNHCSGESSGPGLMRSKSIGSVADLATPSCQLTNHPSSLSLNNVGMLEDPISQIVSPMKIEENEGFSSTAVTPDFSIAPDDAPHLVDSSGSDFDHEIMKLTKERGSYQFCDESKCLIEKLKKEREMCRELEQNIESLEGRISELSKSLERIDTDGSRIIHDVPYKMNHQACERDEYTSGEEGDLIPRDDIQSVVKEGLSEIWLVSREQALNELHHLTEHLLQIVEKLDGWVINSENINEPFVKKNGNLNNIDFWMSSPHQSDHEEYGNHQHGIDLTSFTNMMKEKISEIRRVLGYLYSKKDDLTQIHDGGTPDDETGENGPPSYLFSHSDKSQNEIETQDTENDCSSRASSFTYQPAEFRDKHYDENWDWNQPSSFKPYKKDCFPFEHIKHLHHLEESDRSPSFPHIENEIQSPGEFNTHENITPKQDFIHEMMSPMGPLKPWDNRMDLNDENQFEIISDISSNIVVPTVRKIFSPVFLEENGETSFIEVVINENSPKLEEILVSVASNETKPQEKPIISSDCQRDSSREQSDSPVLVMKEDCIEQKSSESFSDIKQLSFEKLHQIKEIDNVQNEQSIELSEDVEEKSVTSRSENKSLKESDEDINSCFDIGFPPISPLRGRREFKSSKETTSLKRMIAARQNKRIYEIDLNDGRIHRSDSSSPDSRSLERNSEIKLDKNSNKRLYNTINNNFAKHSTTHFRAMSTDRCLQDSDPAPIFPSKGILKSSSTSALKYPMEFDNIHKSDSTQRKSTICETISILEEKHKVSDEPLTTPESLKLRALKIQKAKEDFFSSQMQQTEVKKEVKITEPTIEQKESMLPLKTEEKTVMTKSASEGTVNLNEEVQEQEESAVKKSKFSGLASRLNVVLRRSATTSADSNLRRSLAIPSNHQVKQEEEQEPTRSCPSSPILLRDEPAWWSLNPAKKIFRPKGKYRFNNKQKQN